MTTRADGGGAGSRLRRLLTGSSVKARLTRGGASLAVASVFEQLVRLGRNVLLARILLPEAFGVLALVLTVASLVDSLSQVGIREAIIQSPHADDDAYLNGAWYLATFRGAVVAAVSVLAAPLAAQFYGRMDLIPMFRFAALGVFFQGAFSCKAYVALKKLDTAKWVLVEQLGGLIGVALSVILSLWLHNAWGLIIGSTMESLARTVLSFVVFPFRPHLRFEREKLLRLISFSRGMLGIPILTYVFLQADVFVVGRVMDATRLGFYAMAAGLSRLPDMVVSRFATPLVAPAFARMQDDPEAMGRSLAGVIRTAGILTVPMVAAALLHGDILMSVLYSDRYVSVGLVFGILLAASALRNLSVPFATICICSADTPRLRKVTAIRAGVAAIILYPATRLFGLEGCAAAIFISALVAYIVQVHFIKGLAGRSAGRALGQVWWGCVFSLPVAGLYPVVRAAFRLAPAAGAIAAVASAFLCYGSFAVYAGAKAARERRLESRPT